MPVLAGWLTGEQVTSEIIDQTLLAMGEVLGRYGGMPARNVQAGAGLITYADAAYAMPHSSEPPVLDWVPDRRTLVYRRPLSGMHPLYFIENWPAEGNLLFASEVKALFAVGVPRRLHLPALNALLRYGFIPAPWTIFKDVQVVPAGSILRWQRAKTVVNHATDFRFNATTPAQNDSEHFATLFRDACAAQLPTHEHLVALASGSHASTLATLFTAQQTAISFPVASFSYRKTLNAKAWTDAQRLADACERSFLAVVGIDEPNFWPTVLTTLESPAVDTRSLALHQLLHMVAAETDARVAISGLGASTFFSPPRPASLSSSTDIEPDAILHWYGNLVTPRSGQQKTPLWSPDAAQSLKQAESWEDTLHARKLARQAVKFTDIRQRAFYLDLHLRLPDLLVGPLNQLGTQEHLVVRSPYLTPSITEYLLQLVTADEETRDSLLAHLVQRSIPDAPLKPTKLPLALPTKSFADIDSSDLLQQILAPAAIQEANIFALDAVEALLKKASGKTVPRELLLVFTTQLLYHLFSLEGC
jgi:asparagine synthetase B (glutamine-hydrolysing)